MIINLDKFLVEELKNAGYSDLDYAKLVALYQASRKNPRYLLRQKRKMQEEAYMMRVAEQIGL